MKTEVVAIDTTLPSQYTIAQQIQFACDVRLNLGGRLQAALVLGNEVVLVFQPEPKPQEG